MRTFAACSFLVSLAAGSVHAQDDADEARQREAAARAAFEAGVEATDAERWTEAVEAFERSRALVERAGTSRNLAFALQRARRFVEAEAAYQRFLELEEEDGELRAWAEEQLAAVQERIARVQFQLTPPEARITVDGRPLELRGAELALDPGLHQIEALAPGYVRARVTLSLTEGQTRPVVITLEPARREAPPPRPEPPPARDPNVAAIALIAAGGLALAGGLVALAVGLDDYDAVTNLPDEADWSDYESRYDRAAPLQVTGALLAGLGLASLGVGAVLFALDGAGQASVEVAVGVGAVQARFEY